MFHSCGVGISGFWTARGVLPEEQDVGAEGTVELRSAGNEKPRRRAMQSQRASGNPGREADGQGRHAQRGVAGMDLGVVGRVQYSRVLPTVTVGRQGEERGWGGWG